MKVQTCFLFASVLAGALAAPLHARNPDTKTVYENVVEVVKVTRTVYEKAGQTPAAQKEYQPAPAVPTTSISVEKPAYTPTPKVEEPKPTTTSSSSSSSSPVIVPTTTSSTSTYVAPTTSTTPPPQPTTTTKAAEPAKPSKAAEPVKSESKNSGTGGTRSGEATYYATGLGSCGIQSSDNDYIVAISHVLMDAATVGGNTNGNPLCGKKITCTRGDKTVEVTVVDRCPGCDANDLDFSPAAYKALGGTEYEGRFKMTWEFSS